MRRHRVHADELPAVRWGLHRYLSAVCEDPKGAVIQDVIHGFRLFYRVISYRIGQPDYPSIMDEDGGIDYGTIKQFLGFAEDVYPELKNGTILFGLLPEMEVAENG